MSAFSTTSKNSFPSEPMVCTVMAMMAAMGPIDRIAVSSPAITISGKARMTSMMRRVAQRRMPLPTRFVEAKKQRRKAMDAR